MKVAFVSYEVFPFAKVGGLADVAGAFPKVLRKKGVDVYVFMPKHKIVESNSKKYGYRVSKVEENINLPVLKTSEKFSIFRSSIPSSDVPVYMIANDYYFSAEEVYKGPDLAEQAIFFSNAVLEALKKLNLRPDIIHVNDWQTSLIPVYLKTVYREDPFFSRTALVLTIHNLGYQGIYDPKYMDFAGLPGYLFNIDGLEFYGQINFLKGGIMFCDVINTVSPTYAEEIQTEEYGEKLEGVLKARSRDLYGILNGIDYELYNPATDERIYVNYDIESLEKKWENKVKLQEELKLPVRKDVAVIGMVTRLVDQKGLDILADIFEYLTLMDVQFVLLGTGDSKYEKLFKEFAKRYPKKVSANIRFDTTLAQRIYAGVDMFLMPSKYEPCGLGQMISMRYGTVPVVRYTGGLRDSVKEYDPDRKEGTGFGFEEYDSAYLLKALVKAVHFYYREKEHWLQLIKNCMSSDFSWERSASEYIKLYQEALSKRVSG